MHPIFSNARLRVHLIVKDNSKTATTKGKGGVRRKKCTGKAQDQDPNNKIKSTLDESKVPKQFDFHIVTTATPHAATVALAGAETLKAPVKRDLRVQIVADELEAGVDRDLEDNDADIQKLKKGEMEDPDWNPRRERSKRTTRGNRGVTPAKNAKPRVQRISHAKTTSNDKKKTRGKRVGSGRAPVRVVSITMRLLSICLQLCNTEKVPMCIRVLPTFIRTSVRSRP